MKNFAINVLFRVLNIPKLWTCLGAALVGVLFTFSLIVPLIDSAKASPVTPEVRHTKIDNVRNLKCVPAYNSHGNPLVMCGFLQYREDFHIWEPNVMSLYFWDTHPFFVNFIDEDMSYIDVYEPVGIVSEGTPVKKIVLNVPKGYNIFGN